MFCTCIDINQGPIFLRFNSKMKLGGTGQLIYEGGIYDLNSVKLSRILRILAFQNSFQSLDDEILNIDKFLE